MQLAKKTLIVCGILIALGAVGFFIYLSRTILIFILVALILAIAINPLVIRLKRLKMGRVWASVVAIILLLIILIGIMAVIITPLVSQGIVLAQNLPEITHKLLANPTFSSWNEKFHFADYLNQLSDNASSLLLGGGASVFSIATNVITIVSSIGIILVLTFLLLIEGGGIWRQLLQFTTKENGVIAQRVRGRIMKAVSGFVSGNLFISLIAGVVTFITLWILGVPYKFTLAALVALFDLVPLIGTAIATIVVGLVALTKGVVVAVISVAILLFYQFIEGHIIQPVVYSRSINLSALLIVVASLIGAEIAGITGILLAIPVAAVVQILAIETYTLFKNREHILH